MTRTAQPERATIPAVDRMLRHPEMRPLIEREGRSAVTDALRTVLAEIRAALGEGATSSGAAPSETAVMEQVARRLAALRRPTLRPVFNLTGTVLHTNLGRAPLPPEAIAEITAVAAGASNLEYDLDSGRRGDRDSHLEDWLVRLTGAEAATVVNNNAAAVLLTLNSLALRKEVPVSRGELIEIGGAFRMPDIMARAGCKLREVGTTNRTHLKDYAAAITPRTAMMMRVHTSNYEVQGFTAAVPEKALAGLAHEHHLPFVVDLGSGTLVDFRRYGLPYEPTPAASLADGADLVTFSGDKLLGGPQAGIIVGCHDLVARIKRNPMKRAMRVDKMTIAALSVVLRLYADPDRLAQRLPTLRLLTRPAAEIKAVAQRVAPRIAARLDGHATVTVEACHSQIGSGALPIETLPSAALAIRPTTGKKGAGRALGRLAEALRALPMPVIGRVRDDTLYLDLRCLEDEAEFVAQLDRLALAGH